MSSEQHGHLPGRRGIDDGQALAALSGEIDECEDDLVDPAQVDPVRPLSILQDEPPLPRDLHDAGRLLAVQQLGVEGRHGATVPVTVISTWRRAADTPTHLA